MHGDECMDMNGKLFMLSQEFYFSTRDINTQLIYFISYTTRSDKHMLDYENTILTRRLQCALSLYVLVMMANLLPMTIKGKLREPKFVAHEKLYLTC